MPYEAEISRRNPTAFFFVLDQSGSMSEPVAGAPNSTKSAMLATVVNRLLHEVVLRAQKGDEVWHYFDVALIGYGNVKYGITNVGSAFGGHLQGRSVVSITDLADYPLRVENRKQKEVDATGRQVEIEVEFPIWLEAEHSAGTPMADAMSHTYNLVADWVTKHPQSFPPVVLHVTDGEPSDSNDPRPSAEAIRKLHTDDGNVLMFTLHLSTVSGNTIVFPSNQQSLPDVFAQMLFEMSSELPQKWQVMAAERMGIQVSSGARAFVFNADIHKMIEFLEIGTRHPVNLR